jgi:hypothetical protein
MTPWSPKNWFEKGCRLLISGEMLAVFSTVAIQWGLYIVYKANDCSTRSFAAQVRQVSLCLTQRELHLWSFVNAALNVAGAMFGITVAGLGIGSLVYDYFTRRRKTDLPDIR